MLKPGWNMRIRKVLTNGGDRGSKTISQKAYPVKVALQET